MSIHYTTTRGLRELAEMWAELRAQEKALEQRRRAVEELMLARMGPGGRLLDPATGEQWLSISPVRRFDDKRFVEELGEQAQEWMELVVDRQRVRKEAPQLYEQFLLDSGSVRFVPGKPLKTKPQAADAGEAGEGAA